MVLGVVFPFGTYNAPCTFHDLFMIDVSVVTHQYGGAIVVIHLAVDVVVAFSFHLNVSGALVIQDAAFSVPLVPVRNAVESWGRNRTWLLSST